MAVSMVVKSDLNCLAMSSFTTNKKCVGICAKMYVLNEIQPTTLPSVTGTVTHTQKFIGLLYTA